MILIAEVLWLKLDAAVHHSIDEHTCYINSENMIIYPRLIVRLASFDFTARVS